MISPSNGSAWANTTPLGRSRAESAPTQPLGGRRAASPGNKKFNWVPVVAIVLFAAAAGLVTFLLMNNGSKRGPAIEFGGDDYEAADPEAVVEVVAVEEAAPVDRSNDSGDRVWVKGEASDYKGSYPIRMTFEMSQSGRFVGKYAYEVTLRKYGRGPSSWFVIDGTCGSRGYYTDVEAYTYMYGESEPFEKLDLVVGPDDVTGTLTNLATGEVFDIDLH